MFLFFGIGPKTKRLGFVTNHCQVHGGQAPHELSSYRSWFKLFFFLPVFPVGRERHLLTCSQCGSAYELSPQEAQQLAGQASQGDVPMQGGFGGGPLGQIFGQPDQRGYEGDQRSYDGDQRGYGAAPSDQGVPYPTERAQEPVYGTTPMAAPDADPIKVRSQRLDGMR